MNNKTHLSLVGLGLAVILGVSIPTALAKGAASGGGNGHAAGYPGTLVATPAVLHAGDTFDVSGCGYDTSLGNVVVGFTGGGSGAVLGSDGCFTVSSITALAGDTLAPGTYPVTAYQYVRGKLTATGETTVTVDG